MENGIYVVTYVLGGVSVGSSIIVLRDGSANGGDHGYIISGGLMVKDLDVSGKVRVEQWNSAIPSIFPGYDTYDLKLSGKTTPSHNAFTLTGTLVPDPTKTVVLNGEKKANLFP